MRSGVVYFSTGRGEVGGDGCDCQSDDVRHVGLDARQNVTQYAERHQRHLAVHVFEARHQLIKNLHTAQTGKIYYNNRTV